MDSVKLLEPRNLEPPGYPTLNLEDCGDRSMADHPNLGTASPEDDLSDDTLVEGWQPGEPCQEGVEQTAHPSKRKGLLRYLTWFGVPAVLIVLTWSVVYQAELRQKTTDLERRVDALGLTLGRLSQGVLELEHRVKVHAGTWRRKRDAEWGPEEGWKENWEWKRPRRPKKVRLPSSTTMTPSAIPVTPSPTPSQAPTRASMEPKGTSVPGWSSTLAPWGLSRRTRSTDPAPAPATTTLASPDPSTGQAGESANTTLRFTEVMCWPPRTLTTLAPEDAPRTRRPPLSTRTVPLPTVARMTTARPTAAEAPPATNWPSPEPETPTSRAFKIPGTASVEPPLSPTPTTPEEAEPPAHRSPSERAGALGSGQAETAGPTVPSAASEARVESTRSRGPQERRDDTPHEPHGPVVWWKAALGVLGFGLLVAGLVGLWGQRKSRLPRPNPEARWPPRQEHAAEGSEEAFPLRVVHPGVGEVIYFLENENYDAARAHSEA